MVDFCSLIILNIVKVPKIRILSKKNTDFFCKKLLT